MNVLIFTNKKFPVLIPADDRRHTASESYLPLLPHTYYNEMGKLAREPKVQRAFYDLLIQRDVENKDWIKERPDTEFRDELKAASRDPELDFLIDYVNNLVLEAEKIGFNEKFVSIEELFLQFVDTHRNVNTNTSNTKQKFGILINTYGLKGMQSARTSKTHGRKFIITECKQWLAENKYTTIEQETDEGINSEPVTTAL
jgi:hypothetical protein